MAQGSAKLTKKPKSGGAQKRKAVRGKKTVHMGTRDFAPNAARGKNAAAREDAATTKAINQKNEVAIAAKAVAVGTQFFLSDVASKGEKEMKKQLNDRNKKQSKGGGAANRLKAQLRKLGRNVK